MFDINIKIDDITISSIEKEDVLHIQKWINLQNFNSTDNDKPLPLKEFYERFLEYYISENEFFLKINKDNNLIGVLKGRIEFKSSNEVWLWYFLLDESYRGKGLGSRILSAIREYFLSSLGIDEFYTGVCEKDIRVLKFWKKNKFGLFRISKKFFQKNGEELDMIVMKL